MLNQLTTQVVSRDKPIAVHRVDIGSLSDQQIKKSMRIGLLWTGVVVCGSVTSVGLNVTVVIGGSVINLGSVGSVTAVDVSSGVVDAVLVALDATKFCESTLQPHRWTSKVQSMTDTAASGGRAAFYFYRSHQWRKQK
jgi:hypothetical protein